MTDPVRWGVLGVAGITEAVIPAMLASPSVEVVGIASRDGGRAAAAAQRYGTAHNGILAFEGYDSLLADPRIEAVYLPVPNAQHAEWAKRAAAAGKHVLCEKPLAVTEAEAREMAATAAEHGVLLGEAFMYAHHPRLAMIAKALAEGRIGDVRAIHTVFTFDASQELDHSGFQGAPGSGAIYDVGCYAVHVARHLLGKEPDAVTAHAASSALHGDIDMSTSFLMEFPDGVASTAQVGMWSADQDTIDITGSRGRLTVPHAFLCGPDDGDFTITVDGVTETISVPRVNHYTAQAEHFGAAVRGEVTLRFDAADAVAGTRVLEALTHSWRTRTRVKLGELAG
ncbi:MAG: Gfo/Idh/MocA family oxidoreductase [Demequina sp.]|nr:Gfo/Idh/MocA family oxidoreductase [Demequina sp.]